MRMHQRTRRRLALAMAGLMAGLVATPALPLRSEEAAKDTFDFFLQEAKVVTASRRVQKKSDSPVAIDVITREEIDRSGARNIWDLLRFRVGVNVIEGNSIEGNPVLLNVRGLPEEFSQSLQVLVDGRSVVSPVNSGINWHQIPVGLDEVDRIEIVRGPNSALFGANAGQGVINIITKKPEAGSSFNASQGSWSSRAGHFAMAGGDDRLSMRAGYSSRGNASSPNLVNEQPGSGNNLLEDTRVFGRLLARPWEGGSMDFSADSGRIRYVAPPVFGTVGGEADIDQDYEMLRLQHTLNDAFSLELAAAHRFERSQGTVSPDTLHVYDGDLIGRLSLLDARSQSAIGVSLRHSEVNSPTLFSNTNSSPTTYAYTHNAGENTRTNRLRRAYLSEQLALLEWMSLALAGSYEGSDTGGDQAAYQGALILKPFEGYSLRLSGSKSPTMPSLQNKFARKEIIFGLDATTVPLPSYMVYRIEGTNISAPQVASYEATLSGSFFDRRLNAEVTGFQMELSGFPDFFNEENFAIPGSFAPFYLGKEVSVLRYRNSFNMVLRGAETVLTFKPVLGTTIQLNHTYENVYTDRPSTRYDQCTPWNTVNLVASSELPWGLNAGINVGWQGQHFVRLTSRASSLLVPDQAKVDLRLGYKPLPGVEIYAAGLNLDHQIRTESGDGLAVPQTYMGGINVSWGGSK